jgi:hypothetical protein
MPSLAWTFIVIFGLSAYFGWPMEIKGTYWAISVLADCIFTVVAAVVVVVLWDYVVDYPYYP